MSPKSKLELIGYCVGRYEYRFGKLSNESVQNIINLVLNDPYLSTNIIHDRLENKVDFYSTWFELEYVKLEECVKEELETVREYK